jgi:predicted transcriptional regulator
VAPDVVFRRLALPSAPGSGTDLGLVECDGSGAILFRRPVAGFDLPRYSAACVLWPVFQALLTPQVPRRETVRQFGRDARSVTTYSAVALERPLGHAGPLTARAGMLILPEPGASAEAGLGSTCRLCPRDPCPARREGAVL